MALIITAAMKVINFGGSEQPITVKWCAVADGFDIKTKRTSNE
jgi:hypothetical protein